MTISSKRQGAHTRCYKQTGMMRVGKPNLRHNSPKRKQKRPTRSPTAKAYPIVGVSVEEMRPPAVTRYPCKVITQHLNVSIGFLDKKSNVLVIERIHHKRTAPTR
jgi:hypothetical protein